MQGCSVFESCWCCVPISMTSITNLKFIKNLVKTSHAVLFTPIEWCSETKTIKVHNSRNDDILFSLWLGFTIFSVANSLINFWIHIQITDNERRSAVLTLIETFFIVVYLNGVLVMFTLKMYPDDLAVLLNNFRRFAFRERISKSLY